MEVCASPSINDKLLAIFKRGDDNGNGVLERSELTRVLQALNHTHNSFSAQELDKVMHVADTNGDGLIQYAEFVAWVTGGQDGILKGKDAKALDHTAEKRRKALAEERAAAREREKKELEQKNREHKARLTAMHTKAPRTSTAVDDSAESYKKMRQEQQAAEKARQAAELSEKNKELKKHTAAAHGISTRLEPDLAHARQEFERAAHYEQHIQKTKHEETLREHQRRVSRAGPAVEAKIDPSVEEARKNLEDKNANSRLLQVQETSASNRLRERRLSDMGPRLAVVSELSNVGGRQRSPSFCPVADGETGRGPSTVASGRRPSARTMGSIDTRAFEESQAKSQPLQSQANRRPSARTMDSAGVEALEDSQAKTGGGAVEAQVAASSSERRGADGNGDLNGPAKPESCTGCGSVFVSDALFCRKCGKKREQESCLGCGNVLMSDAQFCRKCGRKREESESCPCCGNMYISDAQFCRKCGLKRETLEKTCAGCGNVFMSDAQFCRKCGQKRGSMREKDTQAKIGDGGVEGSQAKTGDEALDVSQVETGDGCEEVAVSVARNKRRSLTH